MSRGTSRTDRNTSKNTDQAWLEVHARYQEAMAALGQLALSGLGLPALLNHAIERVASALGVELVRVLELQPADKTFVLRAATGDNGTLPIGGETSAGIETQAGFTLATSEPVIMANLATEKRFRIPDSIRKLGVVSGIAVTIPGQPQPYGVLAAHSIQSREFTSDDVYFIRSIANILGVAVAEARAIQALRGSESRMRAVVNNAVDAIITIDERGIIESVNPAAERIFGYVVDEMIGRNVSMLMPQPHRAQHDGYLQNYLRTGNAKIIGIGREVVGLRKDGTTFPIDLAVSEFRMGDRRMFAGSVRDISDRRRLEREILEAAADEQRRIGHDLHDGLCQQLTGVAFATEVLLQKLRSRAAVETSTAEKISQMIDDAITQARQLARGLQPVSLEASGLAAALKELAAKVEDMFRVRCLFECEQLVLVSDNAIATHLYRIAQEAINNAIKHGKAHTLIIELAEESGYVRLTIRDDGIGMGAGESRGDGKGIGLQSMAYRARMIGGTFDIRPGPRGGIVVTCSVPIAMVAPDDAPPPVTPPRQPSTPDLEIDIAARAVAGKRQKVQRHSQRRPNARSIRSSQRA